MRISSGLSRNFLPGYPSRKRNMASTTTEINASSKNLEVKHIIEITKQNTKDVIEQRKHSNKIVDILATLLTQDDEIITAAIHSINRIFSHFIQNELMHLDHAPTQDEQLEWSVEDKYRIWLGDRYKDALEQLYHCLLSTNDDVQNLSLRTLMNLAVEESMHPLVADKESQTPIPIERILAILKQFLSSDTDMRHCISKFEEYIQYNDVKYSVLRALLEFMRDVDPEIASVTFVWNLFTLLSQISLPEWKKNKPEPELPNNLCKSEGDDFKFEYEVAARLFSSLWMQFLKFKMPPVMYIKVLSKLPYKVMPHMEKPLGLTDFLSESYNLGGTASILSLQGIFLLMQKCNLEYPDFYKKLYALFEPPVLHAKHRARLFFWADIFLTSTHLPAYLVAAFVKRISRLALHAPTHVLVMMIPFVRNLFIRHPVLKFLIDKPDGQSLEADPFVMNEPDPSKCKALESSLWEMKTLQSHWYHKVSKQANFINNPLPGIETDLGDLLEVTTTELMEEETNKKLKIATISTTRTAGLFQNDLLSNAWLLS